MYISSYVSSDNGTVLRKLFICFQVSLDELYNGSARKIAIQRNIICEQCKGKGGKEVSIV